MDWNIVLFASRWVLIALIYFVLFLLLAAVRREMTLRIASKQPVSATAGRLKVIHTGSDPRAKPGAVLDLAPETSLGAAADNQLVLADRFVSSRHAILHWDGSQWWLEDLGSRNGTFLNGKQLMPYRPEPASSGASLQLGDMTFQLMD